MDKNKQTNNSIQASDRKQGTFIVKVEYCQNETWQGKVVWAEENRTERFRSMLELIKLMDGAMSKGQSESVDRESSVS
ncbi:MAG: hypothetical protein K6G10_08885 [Butyrivibrio sp.]|nr:hypothetical protein [Butyrivibrio sp.]